MMLPWMKRDTSLLLKKMENPVEVERQDRDVTKKRDRNGKEKQFGPDPFVEEKEGKR